MAARALRALSAALGLVVLQLPAFAHAQLAAGDLEPLAWRPGTVVRTDQAAVGEDFGGNVALGKDLAVVGAKAAQGTGRAHVFIRQGAGFGGESVLAPAELPAGAAFGSSVAVDGERIAVGAPFDGACGTAYVFDRNGEQFDKSPLRLERCGAGDQFGFSIAVSGDTVLVGSPLDSTLDGYAGAAYVFVRKPSGWELQATLLAADEAEPGTRSVHLFGVSVALERDTAVVGASYEPAAYVFERTGTVWSRVARLRQTEPQEGDSFGSSVSLSEGVIAVGAYLRDGDVTGVDAGAVFSYVRTGESWPETEDQILLPAGLNSDASFGYRLSLSQRTLMVTAPYGDWGYRVHSFVREGRFVARNVLTPVEAGVGDAFAAAVSVFDRAVLVGVPNDTAVGSVHPFGLAPGNACDSAGDCAEGNCNEGICCATACDGVCESCVASRKGSGVSGECGKVKRGIDPRGSCSPASCPDSKTEDPADVCDGGGACLATAPRSCGGYLCEAGACVSPCLADEDCDQQGGYVCAQGECLVALGAPCSKDSVCESGICAGEDGMCCDAACEGPCVSCSKTKKGGGVDGRCGVVPAGDDPDEGCDADEGNACGASGSCDGKGQCRSFAPPTQACGATSCEDDSVVQGMLCTGDGSCAMETVDCKPYRCVESSCLDRCASDDDCTAGTFCGSSARCQPRAEDGSDCAAARECASGYCLGSVCAREPRCSDDETIGYHLNGEEEGCYPFRCRAGACLGACAKAEDCSLGLGCNPDGLCEPEMSRSAVVSSCAWRTPTDHGNALAALTFALLLYAQRRRARAASHTVIQTKRDLSA